MPNNFKTKISQFLKKNKEFFKCLVTIIIVYFICTIELPFVVYKPGGIVNLNDRILIKNDNIKGSLSMCYVSLMRGTIPILALSYIFPNWDILPREDVTVANESIDELLTLEKIYMASSINNATYVAYQKAGKPIKIKSQKNNVISITKEAQTDIQIYDDILAINNQPIKNLNDISDILKNFHENDKIEVLVLRKNKKVKTTAQIYQLNNELKMGIVILPTYEYDTDPEIKIKTKSSESGSSGGLMMALAIYNKLVDEDITKGKKVVGTGTIDQMGNVGEIDGVKYKILGAVKNKADIFLCPIENYDEALEVKKDNKLNITVKAVKNFDEALNYLKNI